MHITALLDVFPCGIPCTYSQVLPLSVDFIIPEFPVPAKIYFDEMHIDMGAPAGPKECQFWANWILLKNKIAIKNNFTISPLFLIIFLFK